ncbi:OmpA family protein [Vibrio scophthalmi]|uniref:OmpA family protein n=1 Tax=Vibrio scophthalmi TaxID=45658 RepID=UPI002FF3E38D
MKASIFALILSCATLSTSVLSDDEFDYIQTPKPIQIADLEDDDNDGVVNARDLCPGTPEKADIDNDGCGTFVKTSQALSLHILFDNNSTEIATPFYPQIESMAAFLDQYPETSIELQGFASKTGNSEHNLALSKQRAEEVRQALVGYGVTPSRIRVVGYGDNVSDMGEDEASHAMNRKVVASVVGHKGHVKEEWTIFTTIPK